MIKKDENKFNVSRRSFLRTAALTGAAFCASPVINKTEAAEKKADETRQTLISTQRTLGKGAAAMTVSTVGFGIMGMDFNRGAHPSRKANIELLRQAAERGVTLFDTAERYGPHTNEELAGEALYPYRNKVMISTKFGHDIVDGKYTGRQNSRPDHIKKVAEESLKRLRIDSIPLFYQHRFDPNVPIEDVAGAISDLMKEGKVQRWGLCEVSPEIIRRAHAVQPLTAVQSEYHLMWRLQEEQVLPVLEELGIGFVPYSPINRGFLGGNINEYTKLGPDNDNRATIPRFAPEAIRANYRIVEVLNAFGRTRGVTSAQIALAWLLSRYPWVVPIPGTTKLAHMEENLRAADISFTPSEWKELESDIFAIPIVGDRYNAEEQKRVSH